ncbi:MAG: MCP four helix bundle domain-containing protein, partial [Bradyrhizobium sp.]
MFSIAKPRPLPILAASDKDAINARFRGFPASASLCATLGARSVTKKPAFRGLSLLTKSTDDSSKIRKPVDGSDWRFSFPDPTAWLGQAHGKLTDQPMFSSLSIRTKIVVVVSVLLLAVAAMGAMALRELSGINANLVEVQAKWLQSARTIGDMQAAILRYQTSIRDHLLADDPDTEARIEAALRVQEQTIKDNLAVYETLKTSADDRMVYEEFRKVWETYATAGAEVLAASRNQDFATGRELFTNKLIKIGERNDDLLRGERDLNKKGAEAAVKRGNDLYAFATKFVMSGMALGTLLGLAMATLLVRDVSRGITAIIEPMRALGQGDLTVIIPQKDAKTEIGQMAAALQVFKVALVAKKASDDAATVEASAKIARADRVDNTTREFESVIGELIESLSLSSTELNAA